MDAKETKEHVLASLYGMACGDALGVPTSFYTPEMIRSKWGWIDTFHPPEKGHIFHDGLKAGEYTDDTEQSLALIKAFKKSGKVVPADIVIELLAWADRVKDKYASPLGPSTERALKAIGAGAPITESGRYGNTNGAAMRIAPIGLIHGMLDSSMEACVRDVYQSCIPTHNTTVCVAAASAIAWAIAVVLRGEKDLDVVVSQASRAASEGARYGYPIASPSISRRIEWACSIVRSYSSDPKKAMDELYGYFGGGDLSADSIPTAVALFLLGRGNVRTVDCYCANFGGDCDTNGAMAGAIAGAYSGMATVPPEWVDEIEAVNKVGMPSYADDLIALSRHWQIAG